MVRRSGRWTTKLAGALGLLALLSGCNSTDVLTPPADVGNGSLPPAYSQELAAPAGGNQPVQSAPLGQPGGYAQPVRGPQNSLEAQAAALAQGGRNPVASEPLDGAVTQDFATAPQQASTQQPSRQATQPVQTQAQSQQAALPPLSNPRAASASCRSSALRSRRSRLCLASSVPKPGLEASPSRAPATPPASTSSRATSPPFRRRQCDDHLRLGYPRRKRRTSPPHPGSGDRSLGRARPLGWRSGLRDAADRHQEHGRICIMAEQSRRLMCA